MVYLLVMIDPQSIYASSVADTGTSEESVESDTSVSDSGPSDTSESDSGSSESESDSGPSDTSESDSGSSDTSESDSGSSESDSGPSDTSESDSDISNTLTIVPSNQGSSDDSSQIDELVKRYISILPSADPSTVAQFSPNVLRIAQGTEVNWVNNDDIHHAIHVMDNTASSQNALIMGSKYVQPFGDSFQLSFDKIGDYEYRCLIHPTMSGTIYVRSD